MPVNGLKIPNETGNERESRKKNVRKWREREGKGKAKGERQKVMKKRVCKERREKKKGIIICYYVSTKKIETWNGNTDVSCSSTVLYQTSTISC